MLFLLESAGPAMSSMKVVVTWTQTVVDINDHNTCLTHAETQGTLCHQITENKPSAYFKTVRRC